MSEQKRDLAKMLECTRGAVDSCAMAIKAGREMTRTERVLYGGILSNLSSVLVASEALIEHRCKGKTWTPDELIRFQNKVLGTEDFSDTDSYLHHLLKRAEVYNDHLIGYLGTESASGDKPIADESERVSFEDYTEMAMGRASEYDRPGTDLVGTSWLDGTIDYLSGCFSSSYLDTSTVRGATYSVANKAMLLYLEAVRFKYTHRDESTLIKVMNLYQEIYGKEYPCASTSFLRSIDAIFEECDGLTLEMARDIARDAIELLDMCQGYFGKDPTYVAFRKYLRFVCDSIRGEERSEDAQALYGTVLVIAAAIYFLCRSTLSVNGLRFSFTNDTVYDIHATIFDDDDFVGWLLSKPAEDKLLKLCVELH